MNWCTIFKDNFAQQLASFYDHGGRCFKAPDVRWFLLSIWNHFWEMFSLSPTSLSIFHSHCHPQSLELSRSFSTQPDYLHRSHHLFLLGSLITALHLPLPFLLFLISLTHTPSHTLAHLCWFFVEWYPTAKLLATISHEKWWRTAELSWHEMTLKEKYVEEGNQNLQLLF